MVITLWMSQNKNHKPCSDQNLHCSPQPIRNTNRKIEARCHLHKEIQRRTSTLPGRLSNPLSPWALCLSSHLTLSETAGAAPSSNGCDLGFKFSFGRSASLLPRSPDSKFEDGPLTKCPLPSTALATLPSVVSSSFRLSPDFPLESFSFCKHMLEEQLYCQIQCMSVHMMLISKLEDFYWSKSILSNRLQPSTTNAKTGQDSQNL